MKKLYTKFKQFFKHPLAKGSVIVFMGTMAANASAYFYHLVVGRILGPAAYGELAALLSLSYILNVFAIVLQIVVTRYVAQQSARHEYGRIKALVLRFIGFLVSVGLLCVVLLIIVAPAVANYLHIRDALVVYFLFVGVVISMISVVFASVLQGLQRFTAGMVISNINSILRLVSGALAAGFGVTAILGTGLVTSIVATLITIIPLRKIFMAKTPATPIILTPLFKTSVMTFLAVLGVSILNSQDVILVKHYLPEVESGWYGALSTMGKIIFFASSSIMYVLLPIVSQRSATGKHSKNLIYASIGIVSAISLCITAGFFILPQFAMQLLYGTSFIKAAPYLGLFGVFSSLYTVAYTIVTALLGIGKSTVWIILIGVALAQNILISIFHTDLRSIISLNIGLSLVLVVILLIYYRHVYKEH